MKANETNRFIEDIILFLSVGYFFYIPFVALCWYYYEKGAIDLSTYNMLVLDLGRTNFVDWINTFGLLFPGIIFGLYIKVKFKKEKKKIFIFAVIYALLIGERLYELYTHLSLN